MWTSTDGRCRQRVRHSTKCVLLHNQQKIISRNLGCSFYFSLVVCSKPAHSRTLPVFFFLTLPTPRTTNSDDYTVSWNSRLPLQSCARVTTWFNATARYDITEKKAALHTNKIWFFFLPSLHPGIRDMCNIKNGKCFEINIITSFINKQLTIVGPDFYWLWANEFIHSWTTVLLFFFSPGVPIPPKKK